MTPHEGWAIMQLSPDHVNGAFELGGAICAWINAYKIYCDKDIRGVYWPLTGFFALWGLWNLWYYPALGQMWSFYGGVFLVAGNLIWVAQAVRIKLTCSFNASKLHSPINKEI